MAGYRLPGIALDQHHRESALSNRLAAGHAIFIKAGTAIDGAIVLGQERNLRLNSALSADHSMHLAWGTLRTIARTAPLGATARAATGTTARLVHQTFLLVELLFACGKSEIAFAITAFEGFVNETQNQGPPCDIW